MSVTLQAAFQLLILLVPDRALVHGAFEGKNARNLV